MLANTQEGKVVGEAVLKISADGRRDIGTLLDVLQVELEREYNVGWRELRVEEQVPSS